MSASLCSWRCRNLRPRLNKEYENHFEREVIVTKHTIILCLLLGATSIWAQPPCVADSIVVLPAQTPHIPSFACVDLCAGAIVTVYCIPQDPPCDWWPIVMVEPGCFSAGVYCDRDCPPAQFSYDPDGWAWDANTGYWRNSITGLSDGCVCVVREEPLGPPGYIHLDPANGFPQTACLSFINTAICIGPVSGPEQDPILQVTQGCDTNNLDFSYHVTFVPDPPRYWVTFSGIAWEDWGCYCVTLEGFSADTECSPGDSVIMIAPDAPGGFYELAYCLYFCEGRTYTFSITMCRDNLWPPMLWVSPGCLSETGYCHNEACAPGGDFVVGDWTRQPLLPVWMATITLAPGGLEGCGCVGLMFPLGGGGYWNGDCWLSVELQTFSATAQDDGILIEFATASETNNDYFEILRGETPDGNFTTIAQIPSQGNGASGHAYRYVDADVEVGHTYWYYLADVDLQGNRTEHRDLMSSAKMEAPVPLRFVLFQNYPNPFNAGTEIRYAIPEAGHVSLKVYNAMGQHMTTLVNREQSANTYAVMFDAAALPSGIYVYVIEVNDFKSAHKMALIR